MYHTGPRLDQRHRTASALSIDNQFFACTTDALIIEGRFFPGISSTFPVVQQCPTQSTLSIAELMHLSWTAG